MDLLAPVGVEESLAVEADDATCQTAECHRRMGLDRSENYSERRRELTRPERDSGHDAEGASAATLERPEQVWVGEGIGYSRLAVRGDHLGLQQARRCEPKSLREAPETAALDEPGDADGHAAAPLHVPVGSRRHSVIDVYPDRARPDGNRRSRRNRSRTAVGHKRIVQHDVVHRSCPDQERVRRTGGSVVAVPTAFDDKAHVVLPREVDCSDHVSGLRRGHREGAGSRRPGVEPPRRLRQRRLIAQPVRILEPPERLETGQALGRGPAGSQRWFQLEQPTPDLRPQRVPVGFRRPGGMARTRAIPGWHFQRLTN